MINPMDLTGKQILVTGATGGIGRETAVQLSKLGAKVIVLGRNAQKLEETLNLLEGNGHISYACDLSDICQIEDYVKDICEQTGALHGYVHCAGIAKMRPLSMTNYDSIMETMKTNYFSFVEIVRCLMKKKCFAEDGSIVAMSSIASIHGKPTKTAYSASKAAIDATVRCMVCDLRKKRIRINTVMPSWVNTNMYRTYLERYPDSVEIKEIQEKQYMGVTEPIEVANTIAFLLSDAAHTITGTTILIDGGISQG